MTPATNPKAYRKPAVQKTQSWHEILAADEAMHPRRRLAQITSREAAELKGLALTEPQ